MMVESAARCGVTQCNMPLRVRYCEVDRMGVVHHSRFAVYFEMGRTELLRANGYTYRDLEDKGVFLVVARLDCRFRAPARYDDELVLTTTITKIDNVRIEHAYKLVRPADGKLIAEATTTLVHVDKEGRLQAIPEFLRPGVGSQESGVRR
jgi:acyl-CoA thioester hydrolase